MTSKYFIDNNDLSNKINLNPNSTVNVNNVGNYELVIVVV